MVASNDRVQVYEKQIRHLVDKIVDVCNERDIPVVMAFSFGNGVMCTSDNEKEVRIRPKIMHDALQVLIPPGVKRIG